jgi:hypothetical protein
VFEGKAKTGLKADFLSLCLFIPRMAGNSWWAFVEETSALSDVF